MKWNHLPVAGGIYDQSPDLIDKFEIIFAARARKERQDAKKREIEMNAQRNKNKRR